MFNVIPDHVAGKTRTCIKGLEVLCNFPYTTATTTKIGSLLLIKNLNIKTRRCLNDTNFNGKYFSIIDRTGFEPITIL